jgi:tetratricopeptide (TPR) repeat protein
MVKKSLLVCKTILLAIFISPQLFGQGNYEKAMQALDKAELNNATTLFEKVSKSDQNYPSAQLALALIYGRNGKLEKASEVILTYLKENPDPYPALFALWRHPGVAGSNFAKSNSEFEFIKAVSEDPNHKSKLGGAVSYSLGTVYLERMKYKQSQQHYNEIGHLKKWSFVGPFDNIMNSGAYKTYGPETHPEFDYEFIGLNNAKKKWFVSTGPQANDGYIIKQRHFRERGIVYYAQSFVKSEEEQDVLLKIGFSGTARIWLNDQVVMEMTDPITTEMDFFTYKCRLNKGHNRILVQIGDYKTNYSNYTMRITDLNHEILQLEQSELPQPYSAVNGGEIVDMGNFSIDGLTKMVEQYPGDMMHKILLAKAYMRTGLLDDAEVIWLDLYEKHPKNFFVLRNLVVLYDDKENNTEQNRFYALLKEYYPEFKTILSNQIEELKEQDKKAELRLAIKRYNELFEIEFDALRYEMVLAEKDEDYKKIFDILNEMYAKYPDDYNTVYAKYSVEKSLNSSSNYNKIFENYLERHYSFPMIKKLARDYIDKGKINDAIDLYKTSGKYVGFDAENVHNVLAQFATKKEDYKTAKEYCHEVLANRPYDHTALIDLASFNKLLGHSDSALYYYEKANEIFPYKFETNEKIQELKGLPIATEFVSKVDPKELIAEFEEKFSTERSGSFDIVIDQKTDVLYASSKAEYRTYLLKLNSESSIEQYQELNFSANRNFSINVLEVKTIKANGEEIDAERSGNSAVLLNLEVGDYVFVSYCEKQWSGSKGTLYQENDFSLARNLPSYKLGYHIIAADGAQFADTVVNGTATPIIEKYDGFTKYSYVTTNVEPLKDENLSPPFEDIAPTVRISNGFTWDDIVGWYSDLSSHQAEADVTIKRIVDKIFEAGKTYSQLEKAKLIYDFVCENIKYSSIDFRQSNIVPQKASKVYHSRLGDCKDVSTLYASIAREVGLDVSLILIYTSDNGHNSVVLPSLNFNHCIVKVNFENEPMYLELTSSTLPFGHLGYYHTGAPILEIPVVDKIKAGAKLEYLIPNKKYRESTSRTNELIIAANGDLEFKKHCTKVGVRASSVVETYFDLDSLERFDKMLSYINDDYTTKVTLKTLTFENLIPLEDTVGYNYSFTVDNGLTKVGSFRSLKVPFTDLLAKLNVFEDEDRTYPMDFNLYENTDFYNEEIEVRLDPALSFLEIPEDVQLQFRGYYYNLKFEKIDAQSLRITRNYKAPRIAFKPEEIPDLQAFLSKVTEAETTQLVMK